MGRVVLVTGVAQHLGGRLARALVADPDVADVIGVDVDRPRDDVGAVRFVRTDIRHPAIADVLVGAGVDTVVHMSGVAAAGRVDGRSTTKRLNTIGTMQLLAACQQAPQLRKLVVRSSAAVYGASPRDPAMFTEDMAPERGPRTGLGKEAVEVEAYVRSLSRRRPDITVSVLRYADLVGPGLDSPMGRYLSLPTIPTVLGFDPRLQFCHERDAIDSLRRAVSHDVPGTCNVAGDGILTLSQAARRAGRPTVPVPDHALGAVGGLFPAARLADVAAEQAAYLRYGRGVDTTRMRTCLGFEPAFTTESAFDDFVRGQPPGVLAQDRVAAAGRTLHRLLGGRALHG
ncbi:MAG TPA: NAD-dependent epimerase/dehydratase family protein [Nocardioidaceae bacterium]|nr:NAD-dependent epimerase/dehydratase family protein [Nocardioidaceae bacterium]